MPHESQKSPPDNEADGGLTSSNAMNMKATSVVRIVEIVPPETPKSTRPGYTTHGSATSVESGTSSDPFADDTWSSIRSNDKGVLWSTSTPITPPTTRGSDKPTLVASPESPLARKIKSTPGVVGDATGEYSTHGQHSEPCEPRYKKIFRNATLPMENLNAAREALIKASKLEFYSQPNTSFGFQSNEDTTTATTNGHTTSVSQGAGKRVTATRKGRAAFSDVLDAILPSTLQQRISESINSRKCIASLVKNPGKKCNWSAKKSQEAPKRLEILASSLAHKDYDTFLPNLESLLASVLCGTHYNSAMQPGKFGSLERFVQQLLQAESFTIASSNVLFDSEHASFLTWADTICKIKLDIRHDAYIKPETATAEELQITGISTPTEKPTVSAASKAVLGCIIPFEIHQRIADDASKCVASLPKKPGQKCGNAAKGPKNVQQFLNALTKAHKQHDYQSFLTWLASLTASALCGVHIKPAEKRSETIKELVQRRLESKSNHSLITVGSVSWDDFTTWAEIICNSTETSECDTSSAIKAEKKAETPSDITTPPRSKAEVKSQDREDSHVEVPIQRPNPVKRVTSIPLAAQKTKALKNNEPSEPDVADSPLSDIPLRHQSSLPSTWDISPLGKFRPWQPKRTKGKSVGQVLQDLVRKDLSAYELKSGYIYIFWLKGKFGLLKIGFTKNVDRRLKQWAKQCKQEYQLHKRSWAGELVHIPHVSRVEKLIHAEFKDIRMVMTCEGCGKEHKEWFQIPEKQAVKVFQKWKDWVLRSPYGESTGAWKLKPEFAKELEQVCRPLDPVSTNKPSLRPKNATRRSSRRLGKRKSNA
ncbi:uncharacterized protein BDR25DRAFT_314062 [Lindgomyces ingoldianus]|uniref:Uncharacterized protein n=1 Tax=Lindgomyces ingoldianus TaxID=673940 RepID=A0ACB6QVJ9_9PLEO|nr:uncharacterized protein BDR25DRAFT_314062 [Lindgomyces ingoldianus]KAF2470867.1 hypothetical protein BDR25DRAFT_314062 [Lindgomyces ingoldianus]